MGGRGRVRIIDETQARALRGWEVAQERIVSGDYDLFILDEFTYLMAFGWLDATEVVDWLREHKARDVACDYYGTGCAR